MVVSIIMIPLFLNEPDAGNNHSNLKQSLFDKQADILILGASKANHHYITDSIQKFFKMSVFNAGLDGDNIVTSRVQFEAMSERSRPQIVILDLSGGQMAGNWESAFLSHKAYFGIEKHYSSVAKRFLSYESRLKLQSSLYKINEELLDVMQSYIRGSIINSGFIPLQGSNEHLCPIVKKDMAKYEMGEVQRENLDYIVDYCKVKDIILFIVYSPTLITYTNGITESFRSYCNEKEVPFMCYENDSIFINHPEFFKDYNHLNILGAQKFTFDIINRINSNLDR